MKNTPLTHREIEIVRAVAKGKILKEICDELNITASTLNSHLKNIYLKTGTNNLRELILWAIDNGHRD